MQHIFSTFLSLRSFNATATQLNQEDYHTKTGTDFTTLAVKDIIRNPVYCIADQEAYQYFLDIEVNVYGEAAEFDGAHGISVYNRTKQTKEESDDSTFIHPEFTSITRQKDTSEWIVAVGKHEGFVPAKDWITAQQLKEDICDYVIHTVGPVAKRTLELYHEKMLRSCYRSCLQIADENHVESIAFCCISTGVFMFPNRRAAKIAVQTVQKYKAETESNIKAVFNVFKNKDLEICQEFLK